MAAAADAGSHVRVALRVRPLIARELADGGPTCISQPDPTQPVVLLAHKHSFAFDSVFAPGSAQRAVFDTAVAPLLASFLEGFNATVFAYGCVNSIIQCTLSGCLMSCVAASERLR